MPGQTNPSSTSVPAPQPPTLRACYVLAGTYCGRYRRQWLVAAVFTLLASLVGLLQPWPMQVVIDHVLMQRGAPGSLSTLTRVLPGAGHPFGLTLWAASMGVIIYLVSSGLEFVVTRTWVAIGQRMVYDLAE